jgi:hypothetical protein
VDAARDRFAARGCAVLVVTQAKPEVLSLYLSRFELTVPCNGTGGSGRDGRGPEVPLVCDPDRAAYAAFGLERTGWLTFFKPRVLWGYLRGMWKGHRVKKPYAGEDVLQLGGDFILTRERRLVFAYPSADPIDRPVIADLLAAVPSVPPIPHDR